jgi:glycerophosphoryl diester phosphodiesterase
MTWVIAHRGASADERENTLRAFQRAVEVGADFVELDVQASADGALVVFHDLDLDRLTPLRGPLRTRSLAELREHDIPTLEQVLELTHGRIGVMAELRSAQLFRRHDVVGRTAALLGKDDVLLSFGRRTLQEARRRQPSLRVLQHVGYGVSIRAAADYAWAVGFHNPRVTQRGLARACGLGLETTVYTVNDARRMERLVAMGVSGIFTDRPALLREILSSSARPRDQAPGRAGDRSRARPRG